MAEAHARRRPSRLGQRPALVMGTVVHDETQQPKRGRGRPPGPHGPYALNQKRTLFVRAVSRGMDPVEAVVQAGYEAASARRMALRLARLPVIRAALKEAAAEKTALLEQLDAARQFAIEAGDASAVVEAIRLRCVLHGLL